MIISNENIKSQILINSSILHLLSGTNTQVMQKLGFAPRGTSSCRHRLLPHQGLEQKDNRERGALRQLLSAFKPTHRAITQAENEKPPQTTAKHNSRADKQSSPSRGYSYTKRKQRMSKIQKASASIQSVSQPKVNKQNSWRETTIHPSNNLQPRT